jgi:metal-responsive CopG/Arc/MetJ family transcriptional regulator
MATVNFSVPDDVKEAFNETFKDQNKSAIIADLMREAVERAQRKQRSHEAIASILERRARLVPVSAEEAQAARDELRQW